MALRWSLRFEWGSTVRSLDDVVDQLSYHPATADSAVKHDAVRSAPIEVAGELWAVVPDGPEKTLAMRALQQAGMYCNLAIALTSPIDKDTAAVARVLPA